METVRKRTPGQRAARITRVTRVSYKVQEDWIEPREPEIFRNPAGLALKPFIEEAVLASRSDETLRAREIARVALRDRIKADAEWRRDWNQRCAQREWRESSRTTLAEAFARAAK